MNNPLVRKSLAASFCLLSLVSTAFGQLEGPSVPASKTVEGPPALTFDVVSIRQSGKNVTAGLKILPDGYQASGMSLEETILLAYFPAPYFKHHGELKGGPSWVYDDLYDIEAKVAPADVAEWQSLQQNLMRTPEVLQRMLRTVLSDRLKLVLHSVPAQVDGYALTLSKGNKPKVERDGAGKASPGSGTQLLDGGTANTSIKGDKHFWTFSNASMAAFAAFLSFAADSPIVDRTGLDGKYHFDVLRSEAPPETSGQDASVATDPGRVVPLELEASGFKLNRAKISAPSWNIDSIERPSSN